MTIKTPDSRSAKSSPARFAAFGAACLAGLCAIGLSLMAISEQAQIASIRSNSISTAKADRLLGSGKSPELMLAAADSLQLTDKAAIRTARYLTAEALEKQPNQPIAWSRLAYYEASLAGTLNAQSLAALKTSIRQCGYCDKDLLRWRLAFILDHWRQTPEAVRLDVFRGAEFLRWWYIDGAFLAEARQKAQRLGIPFHDYQEAVVSSVRPQEVIH